MSTKEIKDREVVAAALMQLMKASHPIFYSNEPKICVHNSQFVHGDLDILLGETGQVSTSQHIVALDKEEIGVFNSQLSDTKSEDGRLAAKRLSKNTCKATTKLDLSTTVQPVLQLILMGQLQNRSARQHICSFYMNRYKVRPFIYFPSHDIMMTTNRAYVWRIDDRLMIRGCLIIAILLRFQHLSQIPQEIWIDSTIAKTGFLHTSQTAAIDIAKSYYVKSSFKSSEVGGTLVNETLQEAVELQQPSEHVLSYLSMKDISCKKNFYND